MIFFIFSLALSLITVVVLEIQTCVVITELQYASMNYQINL